MSVPTKHPHFVHTLNRKGSCVPNLRSTGCPRTWGCASIQLCRLAPVEARTEGQLACVPILRMHGGMGGAERVHGRSLLGARQPGPAGDLRGISQCFAAQTTGAPELCKRLALVDRAAVSLGKLGHLGAHEGVVFEFRFERHWHTSKGEAACTSLVDASLPHS